MNVEDEIHFWQRCHHCDISPIVGVRYECQSCPSGPDIDLCFECFMRYEQGMVKHPIELSSINRNDVHEFLPRTGVSRESVQDWLKICTVEGTSLNKPKGRFVVRPEFRSGYESVFGGYGFVVNTSKGQVMLTALHVLDEVIKKYNIDASGGNERYTGLELPAVIDSVKLYDVMEDKWMFHDLGGCKNMITLPGARTGDEEPMSRRDISAFLLDDDTYIEAANLAPHCPNIGDPVWLYAKTSDNSCSRKAVVVQKDERSFVFRYDDDKPLPKGCSGAPILNEDGEVVAINVGAGYFNKFRFGHGNHVDNIQKHLEALKLLNLVTKRFQYE